MNHAQRDSGIGNLKVYHSNTWVNDKFSSLSKELTQIKSNITSGRSVRSLSD